MGEAQEMTAVESGGESLLGNIPPKDVSIPPKDMSIPLKDVSIPLKDVSIPPKIEDIPQKDIPDEFWNELWELAKPIREQKRSSRNDIVKTIKTLCSQCFLSADALSKLLNRKPKTLKEKYLYRMEDVLQMEFPNNPKHPRQAYRTREKK
jgi:ATP-dependent DNA helicase RecG